VVEISDYQWGFPC